MRLPIPGACWEPTVIIFCQAVPAPIRFATTAKTNLFSLMRRLRWKFRASSSAAVCLLSSPWPWQCLRAARPDTAIARTQARLPLRVPRRAAVPAEPAPPAPAVRAARPPEALPAHPAVARVQAPAVRAAVPAAPAAPAQPALSELAQAALVLSAPARAVRALSVQDQARAQVRVQAAV